MTAVAVSNAGSAVLTRISGFIVGMILTPYVLHRLGTNLYGIVIAVGSAYEYLSLLRGGMSAALRRYVTISYHAGRRDEARRYYAAGFWWASLLRSLILLVGVLLAGPICRFLRLPDDLIRDGALGVAFILIAAVVADTAVMFDIPIYATSRTARLSAMRFVASWVKLGITFLAFTLWVPNLKVYGAALIAIEVLPLLALIWMAQRAGTVGPAIPRLEFGDRPMRKELFQYGGLALLSQAAGLLYVSTDNLFIGRIYGPSAVTHYSLGTRWAPLVLSFLLAAVYALSPLFTQLEAQGETERTRSALLRVVAVTSALAVPACLVPCVVGDLFLVHWVGPEYRGSAHYLIAMLAPSTLEAALMPVWMALIARGKIGWIATGDIIVAIGNVGLSLLLALVFHLGLLGFALGNTAALLAKNLLLRPLASRKDPNFPKVREFLGPLPKALLGGAPALVLLYLLRGLYGGGLIQVIVAGAIGGALCLAGSSLAAVGPQGIRYVMQTIAREVRVRVAR
jgi:O-antigen/teichoic acid export membrane protein